jgi:cytochrome c oxidase subunit 1
MGSALIAMIGGLHHWWPKMTGRMYSESLGRLAWLLVFVGFNGTFFPQFVMGSHGMPRRYWDYDAIPIFEWCHLLSTIGSYIMALGFLLTLYYLLKSLVNGPKAPANPWGGRSLEWQCSSPPPHNNFDEAPTVGDCYDFSVLEWDEREQGYHWKDDATRPSAG